MTLLSDAFVVAIFAIPVLQTVTALILWKVYRAIDIIAYR